jgi:hypothetical protein
LYRVVPSDLNDPEEKTKYREKSMEYYNKHVSAYDVNDLKDIDY